MPNFAAHMSVPMQPIAAFQGHTAAVYTLCALDEGSILSSGGDGRIVQWDPARPDAGVLLATVGRPVYSLFLPPGEGLLLAGDDTGVLHVIDLVEGCERQAIKVHTRGVFSMLRLDGGVVACAGGDGSLSLWSVERRSLSLIRQIPLSDDKLRALAASPDGQWLAAACGDGHVHILETTLFNPVHTIAAHSNGVTSLVFHPDKPVLLSGGKDGYLRAWHTGDGFRAVHGAKVHGGTIYAIAFSADGRSMATAGRDKAVKLWNPHDLSSIATSRHSGPARSVNALAWVHGDLFSAGDDRLIHRWSCPEP